jgi:Plasmid encoded RepA protein
MKQIAKSLVRPSHLQLIEAAQAIREKPASDGDDIAFLARQLVQATLPHAAPRGMPPEWARTNGNLTLAIRPGYKTDQRTGKRVCIGYPFGTIPRLLLFWITTEALRTKSRRLELGTTLNAFIREIGLNPATGGGVRSDAKRLRDQMERLFRATISFERSDDTGQGWLDMQIAPRGYLWWDFKEPEQGSLFASWIELSEPFYEAILSAPVPVDIRALRVLKRSPLALDLYAWLAYQSFLATQRGRASFVSWTQVMAHLGTDYADLRDFRRKAKAAIAKIRTVYTLLNVDFVRGGIEIRPGAPAVPCRPHKGPRTPSADIHAAQTAPTVPAR